MAAVPVALPSTLVLTETLPAITSPSEAPDLSEIALTAGSAPQVLSSPEILFSSVLSVEDDFAKTSKSVSTDDFSERFSQSKFDSLSSLSSQESKWPLTATPKPILERVPQFGQPYLLNSDNVSAEGQQLNSSFSQLSPDLPSPERLAPELEDFEEPAEPESAPELPATAPAFTDGAVPATAIPAEREAEDSLEVSPITPAEFNVFPVGLNVGTRNVIETSLVKGFFDGETAVSFNRWLLPFDDVMQALGFRVTPLTNGDLEIRSAGVVLRLNPSELVTDPDLGLALSVADIQNTLGVLTQFDRLDYAVQFLPPWESSTQQRRRPNEQPIFTEGLPTVSPAGFRVTGVAQEFIASGSLDRDTRNSQGTFNALGGAFGGSWFLGINQATPTNASTWSLQEFQYLRQSDAVDLALGSQPTFWQSQRSPNDFWGVSYLQRWGFEPEVPTGAGGFDPRERLQADIVSRSIAGEAEPGTLVQLTQGFSNVVVDEVLVDSSGLYRFDDVPTGGQGSSRYEVRLFPNGQLTATPEVQPANFSVLAGHLPQGASALALSAGLNRQANGFWGSFEDFRGGVTYRRGITETLTLGTGFVQDETTQALAEAFFVNDNVIPMRAAVSALVDLTTGDIDLNANVRLQPSPSTQVNFRGDRFSQRLDASWEVSRNFTLVTEADTRDEVVAFGTRFSLSGSNFYAFGNASIDTQNRMRWNLNSRSGAFGLQHFGDEITTQTQLFYSLSGNYAYGDGHALLLNYETRNLDGDTNRLGTISWRYRSKERSIYGRPFWDVQVGYAIGSLGEGPIAQMTSGILPGVDLLFRYQAVSATSEQDSFRIEISPRLNLQNGVTFANERQEWLRTQGGLLIEPFFDEDGDGVRDADESMYDEAENLELLLDINHQTLNRFRPDIREEGIFVTLPPGIYRVDLDSAGYPLDWSPVETAFAVEARPGQFTHLKIPFQASYTVTGVVTDETGTPLAGQRVEAIHRDSGQRGFSITNAAGVFYLEGLNQGSYSFEVQKRAVENFELNLNQDSENFQELNFRVTDDGSIVSE